MPSGTTTAKAPTQGRASRPYHPLVAASSDQSSIPPEAVSRNMTAIHCTPWPGWIHENPPRVAAIVTATARRIHRPRVRMNSAISPIPSGPETGRIVVAIGT